MKEVFFLFFLFLFSFFLYLFIQAEERLLKAQKEFQEAKEQERLGVTVEKKEKKKNLFCKKNKQGSEGAAGGGSGRRKKFSVAAPHVQGIFGNLPPHGDFSYF